MTIRHKKVRISFHSGYKGSEVPKTVILGRKEYAIEKILERKRVLDHKTGLKREEFTVEMENKTVILRVYESGECEIIYPSRK